MDIFFNFKSCLFDYENNSWYERNHFFESHIEHYALVIFNIVNKMQI